DGVVHRPFRHDVHVAGIEFNLFTLELNHQPPTHDQKQLVLVIMVVPRQFAFDLCDLHVLIVDLPYHFRRPVVTNLLKALLKVDFHGWNLPFCMLGRPWSHYSFRSAVVGSRPAARSAGSQEARKAMTRKSTATEAK